MDTQTLDPMAEAMKDRVLAELPHMSDVGLLRHLLQTQEGDSFQSEQPWSFQVGMEELDSRLRHLAPTE
jgi:hypothetical protein